MHHPSRASQPSSALLACEWSCLPLRAAPTTPHAHSTSAIASCSTPSPSPPVSAASSCGLRSAAAAAGLGLRLCVGGVVRATVPRPGSGDTSPPASIAASPHWCSHHSTAHHWSRAIAPPIIPPSAARRPSLAKNQNARPPHAVWASSALSSSVPAFLRSCAAVPGAVGVVLAARRGVVLVRVPCSLFARRRQATGGIRIARSSVASSAFQRMCHSTVEAAPTLARATSGTSRHCMGLHLATTSYHWHPSAPSLALHRPAETTRPLHHHHRLPKSPEPRNDLVNAMRQCHAMPLVLDNAMPCHAVQ